MKISFFDNMDSKIFGFLARFNLNVNDPQATTEFSYHFFFHAFISSMLLTVPWKHSWALVVASLAIVLGKELIIDGHWKDFFKNTAEGIDGRTDILSRGVGAMLPLLTLLWKN